MSQSNSELIKELRALTQAGMKDCKDALEETNWDLQKAVDVIKIKGLSIADGRTGRVASEGRVDIAREANGTLAVMLEVNCQTDFVANSKDFTSFVHNAKHELYNKATNNALFAASDLETERKAIVSTTKENIVVRRWWVEQAFDPMTKVFAYQHSNNKIGVLVTLRAASNEAANSPEFKNLGEDLAMQIAAMNPLAISPDHILPTDLERQKSIFETQLKEENKPEKMWAKILEGKFRKWNVEVCLLEQESVIVPKTQVKQVIKNMEAKLGEVKVVNFIRCQVGEGLATEEKPSFREEVEKLSGVQQDWNGQGPSCNPHDTIK